MNAPEAIADVRTALTYATLPALGAPLDTGTFVGLTTGKDGKHYAVALLPDKPEDDEELTWKAAMAWAESVGGVLPQRPVSALLLANAKSEFREDWYWTGEEHGGSYAWYQYFFYGNQNRDHKDNELSARAVRLIQLTA